MKTLPLSTAATVKDKKDSIQFVFCKIEIKLKHSKNGHAITFCKRMNNSSYFSISLKKTKNVNHVFFRNLNSV